MKGVIFSISGVLFCVTALIISSANLTLAFVLGGVGVLITVVGWFIRT